MEYKGSQGVYTLVAQPMKAGGEGSIYALQSHTDMVAKIYHPEKLSSELEEKITFMTNNPPESTILDQIAWPLDVLRDFSGRFVGFVMPKLSIDTDLKAIYAYPPSKKIPITYEQKVIVAINICIVISAIHKAGYTFGDFNPLNIGINLKNGHVAFLDTDSYHIKDTTSGKVYRCEVCLDGYVAPELIQHCKGTDFAHAALPTFTQETDRFALAIHVFKLLMNGYTPFNGIKEGESASQASPGVGNLAIERDNYCFKPGNKPQSVATPEMNSLTPDLQYLFKKTFLGGANDPSQRATADEWLHALCEYKDNLTKCSKDPAHFYYINNNTCPYCEADKRYNTSMAKATRPSSQSQMNFGAPVNVPSQNSQLNQLYKQNKKSNLKRILLWIFFFPIMLCITIGKSKMRMFWKVVLIYSCISMTLSTIGLTAQFITSYIEYLQYEQGYTPGPGGSGTGNKTIVLDNKYQLTPNDTGYTISVLADMHDVIAGKIEIPSAYEGVPITAIAESGFANCFNATSFVVPNSITFIGEGAFKGCARLESITIPFVGKSMMAEKHEAVFGFIFGYEMNVVNMPSESDHDYFLNEKPVDIIGKTWQFTWREYKEKHDYYYNIPASLTSVTVTNQASVPVAAFNGCANLTSIKYTSANKANATIGTAAFQNCTNLKFSGENGDLLQVDAGVISIGEYAFAGCVNVKTLLVPESVRSIGNAAFKGCNNIEAMTVPFVGESEIATKHQAVLGYIFGYEMIVVDKSSHGDYNFFLNEKPVDILGETWQYTLQTYSEQHTYYYFIPETLNSITVTKQTTVPVAAFNGCSNLTSIKYTSTNKASATIGEAAFQNCTNLVFEEEKLIVADYVTEIGANAYAECKNIKQVVIPNSVRSIGCAAFKGCNNIESISLPFIGESEAATKHQAVLGYIFGYEMVVVDKSSHSDYNFFLNEKPVDILGETWQYTLQAYSEQHTYYYFIPESLTAVTVTKQATVPTAAFNGCENLTSINYTASSKENATIGEAAFQNCSSLIFEDGKLIVSDCVIEIGANAYAGCKNIHHVEVPKSVRSIGCAAFKGCDNIQSLKIPFVGESQMATQHQAVLGYIFGYDAVTTDMPSSSKYDFFLNEKPVDVFGKTWQFGWREYRERIDYYYYIPESLKSVEITAQSTIPTAAFNGCSNLATVIVPVGSTYGEAAFQNCTAEIIQK